jgi:hypothetical protein
MLTAIAIAINAEAIDHVLATTNHILRELCAMRITSDSGRDRRPGCDIARIVCVRAPTW